MRVLVINSGSSSIKFSMFAVKAGEPQALFDGGLSGIGASGAKLAWSGPGLGGLEPKEVQAGTLGEAIRLVFDTVSGEGMPGVEAVGYRVVHPGPKLKDHVRITEEVLRDLKEAVEFAPLHDPAALAVIEEGRKRFPGVAHYACFDTVFHETMPEEATTYPIPKEYRDKGVRRYGFHGLSCESVVRQLRISGEDVPRRMVIAHLGSGCSVTALVEGRSVDTTMGLTPTGGVVMGTRPGDLDPGLVLYLLRAQEGVSASASASASANTGVLPLRQAQGQDDGKRDGGKVDGGLGEGQGDEGLGERGGRTKAETNTGVSPLRCAPVEMTASEVGRASVERTASEVGNAPVERTASALETMLNHDSGMVALSGMRNDVKAVRAAAGEGNAAAVLALRVFTRSVRKAIGGFAWLLGGLDAVVFTGGIGEHDAASRAEILEGLEGVGVEINSWLNGRGGEGVRRVEASHAETAVYVAPAQEDLMIALHVDRMAGA